MTIEYGELAEDWEGCMACKNISVPEGALKKIKKKATRHERMNNFHEKPFIEHELVPDKISEITGMVWKDGTISLECPICHTLKVKGNK